ncbi:glycoside hydrolase family 3 C-terminal domain-containing protein [Couchioplanes caeruleus]|uniref:beta-glucosidase family protein n=1 Tax=Couchioplanes caeruleus TaxID=56438 RepID=UPI00201C2DE2|nr:glycoside hydrolase family 3 C-terminal domain-containing protein [Couchioplanes caeruleus]UQU63534.1 glycoside hydrolase family 3 C-terminal domain-containing protein [Couchioplanes caeruleus]
MDDLIKQLTLEEKVSLLGGQDFWSLPAIPRIGLRSLVMSDGPIGVRGTGWAPEDPSIALPSPTALAATWDPALARTAGSLLGQESRRKDVHVLLGPTVNLQRTPLGGRHFECYSEDPLLSGEIAVGFVEGVQAHGVGTTVKHLVGNDFETDRMTVDVRIGERALREIYLAPFERVVAAGGWGLMSAYNGVNGLPMASNGRLQSDVLKDEWGFDGIVVSDWRAARDTVGAALGGLDIAMPAMENPWGEKLVAAVRAGEVPEELIDDKVRRVLRLAARVGVLDGVPGAVSSPPADLDGSAVAHEVAARSFVLARNEHFALPLEPAALNRIAVIGALATDARVLGGGSAQVTPPHVISPLEGLTRALPGVDVAHAVGADPRPFLPALPQETAVTLLGADHAFTVPLAAVRWIGDLPGGIAPETVTGLELRTTFTPQQDGEHTFAVSGFGTFELIVGEESLYSGTLHPPGTGRADLLLSPKEQRAGVTLAAGVPVEVTLRQTIKPGMAHTVSATLGHQAPGVSADSLLAEAVELARESDVAIVVVGTTEQVESEGFDRTSLELPGNQDELVVRVAAANPRTIVVVNAGSPVLLPWADDVAAVLLTWFPGQEAGAALADVLLGVAEPGGRLPTTWPRREQDCPILHVTPRDGVVEYDEGVFIGYRAWDRAGTPPLYAFGHGLGYTTWRYETLEVSPTEAVVSLTNTGARAGREVVQVYAGPAGVTPEGIGADGVSPQRPARWLAGFAPVEAHPGETVTVRIPLPERTWQVWDGGWRTIPGAYALTAAHALDDPRLTASLEL